MKCNKKTNLKNGWNRYCSVIDKIAKIKYIGKYFKNDTVFGVYLGCICKEHDIQYSKEGIISKVKADFSMFIRIFWKYLKRFKIIQAFIIAPLMYLGVVLFGFISWKKWSSKWADRYK